MQFGVTQCSVTFVQARSAVRADLKYCTQRDPVLLINLSMANFEINTLFENFF